MENAPSSKVQARRSRSWFDMLRATAKAWSEDNALQLSAALAYYSVFSIAPLLIITIAIAGLFLNDEAASGQLYHAMRDYVGVKAAAGVEAMVQSASKPTTGIFASIIGGVTLLIGASGVLGQLKDALNVIWEVRVNEGLGVGFFLRSKILNFGMVLVIGLLLLFSLVLSSWLAMFNQTMESVLTLPPLVWTVITGLLSTAMATTLFAMLFKLLPDARVRWRDVWVGAAITAVLFEIGKIALGWYLGRESTADAYGSAGSVVLLILWVYYASCILLFGAEFTQVYAVASGHEIAPKPYAQRIVDPASVPEGSTPVPVPAETRPAALPVAGDGQPAGVFHHRLLDPLIKYLEGRGLLISLEAKEALSQTAGILIFAAVCAAGLFVGWTLLAVALVGVLTKYLGWYWVTAVALTGGVHVLLAAIAGLLVWKRTVKGVWFAETINEFRKDRLWLRKSAH